MHVVSKSILVRYPAQFMFRLVEDIEAYPQFLPWCRSSRILRRQGDEVDAEIEIARGAFHKKFATRNRHMGHTEIRLKLLDGPFTHLQGAWTFQALHEEACKVSLNLEFEISGRLANLAFGAMFGQICNTLVGAFSQRAKEVYGPGRAIGTLGKQS